jgi:3-oxoacyl-[acyl-carrier protein] reductase
MIDTRLKDKVVLLTGANHGIGAATAQALAAEGAQIFITYLRLSPEAYGFGREEAAQAAEPGLPFYHHQQTKTADAVVGAIRSRGGQADAWEADLVDPATIPAIFDRAEAAFGPVDVLVNNAAYCQTPPDTIFTISAEGIDQHFAVNTRATVLMMAEFVRRYQRRGGTWGSIVNVSTDAAQTFAGQIAYGASKAAIEAFTRSIAIEVGPLNITVNTIAPGPVQTGYIPAEAEDKLIGEIPLRRIGRPEDIADVIVFLASHQARWLTGQVIKVSGGHAL